MAGIHSSTRVKNVQPGVHSQHSPAHYRLIHRANGNTHNRHRDGHGNELHSEVSTCVAPVALPELAISVSTVEATEGSTATYTVSLTSAPSADTTVILSVGDDSVATISTTEITFTNTDWSEDVTATSRIG